MQQRPGNGHSPPHAAAELFYGLMGPVSQSQRPQQGKDIFLSHPVSGDQPNIGQSGKFRQEPVFLKYGAYIFGHTGYAPCGWLFQPHEQAEKRGLAAAGRTQKHRCLSGWEAGCYRRQSRYISIALSQSFQTDIFHYLPSSRA